MKISDSNFPAISQVAPRESKDPPGSAAHKLTVVLPDVAEEAILASRVLALARARSLSVLLLGVCFDSAQEVELRRKLVTLAAFIRDEGLHVEIRVEGGRDWIEKVRAIQKEDDLLACYAGQSPGVKRKPWSDMLSSRLNVPVYVFPTLEPPRPSGSDFWSQLVAWTGSIAILLGFLWLQIKITQPRANGASTILLILSVLAEIGLIWAWNSLSA